METLYIVVYRASEKDPWQEKTGGVFTDRRLAENFVEILRAQRFGPLLAIVEGPIVCPEDMAEAEARLGQS